MMIQKLLKSMLFKKETKETNDVDNAILYKHKKKKKNNSQICICLYHRPECRIYKNFYSQTQTNVRHRFEKEAKNGIKKVYLLRCSIFVSTLTIHLIILTKLSIKEKKKSLNFLLHF